jgi:quinolinate synthase
MTAMRRIELENILSTLKDAQAELRIAISEEDDGEACDELRKMIAVLQDVCSRIQLSI